MVDLSASIRLGSQRFLARSQAIFDAEADKFELYYLNNIAALPVETAPTSGIADGAPTGATAGDEDAVDAEIAELLARLRTAEQRERDLGGAPEAAPTSPVLEELRASSSEVLSAAWHSKWSAELQRLHKRCWELMSELADYSALEDAAAA